MRNTPEHGVINPDNLLVLGSHLQAAASELAFETGDSLGASGADTTGTLLDLFCDDGLVHLGQPSALTKSAIPPDAGAATVPTRWRTIFCDYC